PETGELIPDSPSNPGGGMWRVGISGPCSSTSAHFGLVDFQIAFPNVNDQWADPINNAYDSTGCNDSPTDSACGFFSLGLLAEKFYENGHTVFADLQGPADDYQIACTDSPPQTVFPGRCPFGTSYNSLTETCDAICGTINPLLCVPPLPPICGSCQRVNSQNKCADVTCPVCQVCDAFNDTGDGDILCVPDPLCDLPPPDQCPTILDCDGVTPFTEYPTPCSHGDYIDRQTGCCKPCCCAVNQVHV